MKKLISGAFAGGLILASLSLSAQTSAQPQPTPARAQSPTATNIPVKSVDRGSEGAITMEEYETLLKEYQVANPGKTFQNMGKEEFETYLTTELSKLRQKRAAAAKQQPAQPKTEGVNK